MARPKKISNEEKKEINKLFRSLGLAKSKTRQYKSSKVMDYGTKYTVIVKDGYSWSADGTIIYFDSKSHVDSSKLSKLITNLLTNRGYNVTDYKGEITIFKK